jgi:hypothetical protein
VNLFEINEWYGDGFAPMATTMCSRKWSRREREIRVRVLSKTHLGFRANGSFLLSCFNQNLIKPANTSNIPQYIPSLKFVQGAEFFHTNGETDRKMRRICGCFPQSIVTPVDYDHIQ